jgi:type IV secretion system protein VirB10
MPEIEDRTPRPRGVIPKTMWITLAVLAAVTAAPFISVYIMSRTAHQKQFSMRQGIQVPSDKEVYTVADSLQAQAQGRRQQTQPQQQMMAAPMVMSAAPVSGAKQEDPAVEEYRRHRMEEKLMAPMAPIFGDQARVPVMPQLSGLPPGMPGPNNDAQVRQVAALMNLATDPNLANSRSAAAFPHASPLPSGGPPVISTSSGNPFVVPDGAFNHAHGPGYFVPEGTLLDCTLENKLDGQFDGPLWCDLTEPLASFNGQRVLIPVTDPARAAKMTRLEGESKRVEAWGQTRLGIFFRKLYMPDGYEIWFYEDTPALDSNGAAGLHGHVNNHILSSFGASLAIGLLGAAGEIGTGPLLTERGAGRLEEGAAMGMSMSSMQILSKFLNRMPTITVPKGTRIQVYLASNYALPEYSNHDMPVDF